MRVGSQPSTRSCMRVGRAGTKPFDVSPLKPESFSTTYLRNGQRLTRRSSARGYAFSSAPSGMTPFVTYRHKAIISRRANATMPMRRVTAPKAPVIPLAQGARRLKPQPRPRDLDGHPPDRRNPAARQALILPGVAAGIGRRDEAR